MKEKMKMKIRGGLYLVLDPAIPKDTLLEKLKKALEGGVNLLQIWNHWPVSFQLSDKKTFIQDITTIASEYEVPVLINEEWELLKETALSGIHFDRPPKDFQMIKKTINKDFIIGITAGNDLQVVEWAEKNQLDYVSFCALFPSKSAGDCEIVTPATIKKARSLTTIPFFVSGGITVKNLASLNDLDIAGVAVISGILNTDLPEVATLAYIQALNKLKK